MRKLWPGLTVFVVAVAFSLWAAPQLPERVATHWGLDGQPDGWSSRTFALWLLPMLGIGAALLFAVLPKVDPRKESYQLHGPTYWMIANTTLAFLSVVHAAMIAYGIGWPVDVSIVVGVVVGILLVVIGNAMTRLRPNWFMGIRTPWTLSDDGIWRQTHRLGGYLFSAAGLLVIVAGILRLQAIAYLLIGAVIVAGVVPIVYSYVLWRRRDDRAAGSQVR